MTDLNLRTVMTVPMRHRGRVIGVLYVDSKSEPRPFTGAELVLLEAISDQAAVAIVNAQLLQTSLEKERQDRDLEIARDIQRRLLPAGPLDLPGLEIFGCSHPAQRTGGDCFDYLRGPDGTVRLVVGDVAGKGIPATLFMATARALLRGISASEPTLTGCTSKLNVQLVQDMEPGEFMTLFLAEIDPESRSFTYVGAGHDGPLHAGGDAIQELETTGRALGVTPESVYRLAGPVALEPGDVLLVFTDGITEAGRPHPDTPDGYAARERFGVDRLKALLLEVRDRSAREIAGAVREAVATWRGSAPQDDDETLVVVKVLGGRGPEPSRRAHARGSFPGAGGRGCRGDDPGGGDGLRDSLKRVRGRGPDRAGTAPAAE